VLDEEGRNPLLKGLQDAISRSRASAKGSLDRHAEVRHGFDTNPDTGPRKRGPAIKPMLTS
jgi:hypothetical protein